MRRYGFEVLSEAAAIATSGKIFAGKTHDRADPCCGSDLARDNFP
jgi:hypothetical protein